MKYIVIHNFRKESFQSDTNLLIPYITMSLKKSNREIKTEKVFIGDLGSVAKSVRRGDSFQ